LKSYVHVPLAISPTHDSYMVHAYMYAYYNFPHVYHSIPQTFIFYKSYPDS